jgi:hypothetical protein
MQALVCRLTSRILLVRFDRLDEIVQVLLKNPLKVLMNVNIVQMDWIEPTTVKRVIFELMESVRSDSDERYSCSLSIEVGEARIRVRPLLRRRIHQWQRCPKLVFWTTISAG